MGEERWDLRVEGVVRGNPCLKQIFLTHINKFDLLNMTSLPYSQQWETPDLVINLTADHLIPLTHSSPFGP